jgi:hypothetical protein
METKDLNFFLKNLWVELNRFDENNNLIQSVTCTDENYNNLFNSQFDKTIYGQVFNYTLYGKRN